jgi:hypothetical protein
MARVEANNHARQRLDYLQTRWGCCYNLLDARNGDSGFHGTRGNCSHSGATASRLDLFYDDVRGIAYHSVVQRRISLLESRPRVSLQDRKGIHDLQIVVICTSVCRVSAERSRSSRSRITTFVVACLHLATVEAGE